MDSARNCLYGVKTCETAGRERMMGEELGGSQIPGA